MLNEIKITIDNTPTRKEEKQSKLQPDMNNDDKDPKMAKLKKSAKNNTEKDFEFAYFDNIDDALIEGLEQNQDFFSLLLGNDEMKKKVLGIFEEEIFNILHNQED